MFWTTFPSYSDFQLQKAFASKLLTSAGQSQRYLRISFWEIHKIKLVPWGPLLLKSWENRSHTFHYDIYNFLLKRTNRGSKGSKIMDVSSFVIRSMTIPKLYFWLFINPFFLKKKVILGLTLFILFLFFCYLSAC
jgi:hypothetical protein